MWPQTIHLPHFEQKKRSTIKVFDGGRLFINNFLINSLITSLGELCIPTTLSNNNFTDFSKHTCRFRLSFTKILLKKVRIMFQIESHPFHA